MSSFTGSSFKKDNPWKTVNDMLMQNKCWFCKQVFKRGKLKKVFQLYQVLQYFERRAAENLSDQILTSENLAACWEQYEAMGGKENISSIISDMQQYDIETWMSGLTCYESEDCQRQYKYIFPEAEAPAAATRHDKLSMMMKECPPGCGCDNPWPFISEKPEDNEGAEIEAEAGAEAASNNEGEKTIPTEGCEL